MLANRQNYSVIIFQIFKLDFILIMQISQKNSENSEVLLSEQLRDLAAKKKFYEGIISRHQNLTSIITEKQQIANSLHLSNRNLHNEIAFRSKDLLELRRRLEQFQKIEEEVTALQDKQRDMESQYEDYSQLNAKLDKQLKVLQEEAQIIKGKTIIQYNKITQAREETAIQTKQKEILEKHRDELRKGVQNLKKKIVSLKDEQKKKQFSRYRIDQPDMERQIKKLHLQIQFRKSQLEDQAKSQQNGLTEQAYNDIMIEIEKLKKGNVQFEQIRRQNQKMMSERAALKERIKFLESVDIEFINQKKVLLVELNEKFKLFASQRQAELLSLAKKQEQLAEIQKNHPEGLSNLKKNAKKKRNPRHKSPSKKVKELPQQPLVKQVEQKTVRFKGHKLKRALLIVVICLLIFGLVLNHYIGYFI